MELSIFVAKILALVYLSAGVAALSGKISLTKVIDELKESQALTYITGLFTLIIGMILIEFHNVWAQDWTVLITIIGWIAFLKGVALIAFPDALLSFRPMFRNTKGWGVLMLFLGFLFGYFAFVAV